MLLISSILRNQNKYYITCIRVSLHRDNKLKNITALYGILKLKSNKIKYLSHFPFVVEHC